MIVDIAWPELNIDPMRLPDRREAEARSPRHIHRIKYTGKRGTSTNVTILERRRAGGGRTQWAAIQFFVGYGEGLVVYIVGDRQRLYVRFEIGDFRLGRGDDEVGGVDA